jgi:outer membrane protein assembly factor BamB
MKLKILFCFSLVTVLALGALRAGEAAEEESRDWPFWRGPDRNGITDDKNWDPMKVKDGVRFLWRRNVGHASSSFTVREGRVYTQGCIGQRPNVSNFAVFCLDANTGQELWHFPYPAEDALRFSPNSTPVVNEAFVYFMSNQAVVYALDAQTGARRWTVDLKARFKAQVPQYGAAGSPLLVDDLVILNACKSGVALKRDSGKPKWASGKGHCGYATPVLVERGRKKYVAMFSEKALNLVDLKSGRVRFSRPWVTQYCANAADPLIAGSYLLITSAYEKGCSLLSLKTGAPAWTNKALRSHYPSPVFIDGHIFGVDGQSGASSTTLNCVDVKTGREKWRGTTGFGSFNVADGKLIFLNRKGDLVIIDANPEAYREIARMNLFGGKQRGDGCVAAPVLCRGRIYCRSATGALFCIDVSK